MKIIKTIAEGEMIPGFYLPYLQNTESYTNRCAPIPLAVILLFWYTFLIALHRAYFFWYAVVSDWRRINKI